MNAKLKYYAILAFLIFGIVNFGFQLWYHLTKDTKLSTRYYNVPLNREITEFELYGKINHQGSLTRTINETKNGTNEMYYPGQRIPELKARAFQELSHEVLKRALTYQEHNEYKELIFDITEIFRENNIRYMMAHGTLLGSYFFHDMIPWDDEVDLLVDYNDYPRLKKVFHNQTLWSKYQLYGQKDSTNEYEFDLLNKVFPDNDPEPVLKTKVKERNRIRYHLVKIFSPKAKETRYPWKWPFIDVAFFKYNGNHFWNHDKIQKYSMPLKHFFPFHLRPFMGMWLPAPHKTSLILKQYLLRNGGDAHGLKCRMGNYDHKAEKEINEIDRVEVPCSSLNSVYVNIIRSKLDNGKTNESAFLSGKLLYSTYVDENFDDVSLN